jgi:hypothetical protein
MIATVVNGNGAPCIVRWTGRKGLLQVVTQTYCGEEVNAGDGVLQLPDHTALCPKCMSAVAKVR